MWNYLLSDEKFVIHVLAFGRRDVITARFMSSPYGCSEAEWMLETIVDDYAQSLDLADRARFYRALVELMIARRDSVQRLLDGTDPEPDPLEHVH